MRLPASRGRTVAVGLVVFASLLMGARRSDAQFIGYTSSSSFFAAVPAGATTTTTSFDALSNGTTLPNGSTIDGVTYSFQPAIAGDLLQITNLFQSPSAPMTLGTNVAGNLNQFTGGSDTLSLTFALPTVGFGLYFLSADAIFADDFRLVTSQGTASNSATPETTYTGGSPPYGGNAYFVGFTTTTPITSVDITYGGSTPPGSYFFVLDNVTVASVPEPGPMALTGIAILGACLRRALRRRRAG